MGKMKRWKKRYETDQEKEESDPGTLRQMPAMGRGRQLPANSGQQFLSFQPRH